VSEPACRACRGEWPAAEAFIADCGPTKAYLHEDQFFPGWTVLVLERHVTELYDLEPDERGALMDAVSEVARAVAAVYHAVKMNYALLGNQLPHIHWHLIPRSAADPIPREPVWALPHEPRSLSPGDRRTRIEAIRGRLGR
jgi:diadenosine tetraphosphate (Ap4A) HIT family hydrolase